MPAKRSTDVQRVRTPALAPLLYSPDNAAIYLDVSRATIYRWMAAGRLTGFCIGRLRRFTRDELEALAAELAEEGGDAA